MTRALNERVQDFRSRPLTGRYPVIWTDALYEKVRMGGRVVISMAVLVACGVSERGQRAVLAMEPMMEESKESYSAVSKLKAARNENFIAWFPTPIRG